MTAPWKPSKPAIALKPSRIRRDPVRLSGEPEAVAQRKLVPPSRSEELWGGIVGIVLFAATLTVAIIGIAAASWFNDDPGAEADARHFGQCYNNFGPNCVLDGGTARIAGETVAIAGLEVPRIGDAACDNERNAGIDAAVRLADLLNGGQISVGRPFRDEAGRAVRPVQVGGNDVADALVKSGLARKGGEQVNWCTGDVTSG